MHNPGTTIVDPQIEADITAFHRGREHGLVLADGSVNEEFTELQEPYLAADSPVIKRELDYDLFNALQQGAI